MFRFSVFFVLVICFLTACAPPKVEATLPPQISTPTHPLVTDTIVPTDTPQPTKKPSETPDETPTPTPTLSPTPMGYQKYHIELGVETFSTKVWMPAPRYWDGQGVYDIKYLEISPEPTNWFREENGTEVLYWVNRTGKNNYTKSSLMWE